MKRTMARVIWFGTIPLGVVLFLIGLVILIHKVMGAPIKEVTMVVMATFGFIGVFLGVIIGAEKLMEWAGKNK